MRIRDFEAAASLLEGDLVATRGRKETTDHPPIYPTQAVYPNADSVVAAVERLLALEPVRS